jgi:hypothetical protein
LLPAKFFGVDRAIALEQSFETAFNDVTGVDILSRGLRTMFCPNLGTPLLLFNSFETNSKTAAVLTAVPIEDRGTTYPLQVDEKLDLRLSTAAVLRSRFPIILPTGIILPKMRFVDGGYFDNTGTRTLAKVISQLSDVKIQGGLRFI